MIVPATEVDGDKRRSGFHQTAGQQRTLSPAATPISFAQLDIFFANVKGGLDMRTGDQVVGFLLKLSRSLQDFRLVHPAAELVERFEHLLTTFKPVDGHSARWIKRGDRIVVGVGIPSRGIGVKFGTQKVSAMIARYQTDAGRIRDGNVRRHSRLAGASEFSCDRSDGRVLAPVVKTTDTRFLAGQHNVAAGKMISPVMVDGTDQGKLVSLFGLQGKHLRNIDTRHVGLDRFPNSTVFFRRFGLHVVSIKMTQPAIDPDHDDRGLFPGILVLPGCGRKSFGSQ